MRAGGQRRASGSASSSRPRVQGVARHRPPVPVVVLPGTGHLLRHFGRNESGAQGAFGGVAGDGHDFRQHSIKPWHKPLGGLGKQPLHVDRNVKRRAVEREAGHGRSRSGRATCLRRRAYLRRSPRSPWPGLATVLVFRRRSAEQGAPDIDAFPDAALGVAAHIALAAARRDQLALRRRFSSRGLLPCRLLSHRHGHSAST